MKNSFLRTGWGKALLFLLCVLSFCTAIISGLTVLVMLKNSFYTGSLDDAAARMLEAQLLEPAYDSLGNYDAKETTTYIDDSRTNIIFELFAEGPSGDKIRVAASSSLYENSIENPLLTGTISKEAVLSPNNWVYTYTLSGYNENTYLKYVEDAEDDGYSTYTYVCALKEGLPVLDSVRITYDITSFLYEHRAAVPVICVLSGIIMLVSFILLMCVSGKKKGIEGIANEQSSLDIIPSDLFLAIIIGLSCFYWEAMNEIFASADIGIIIGVCVVVLLSVVNFLFMMMVFAARFKNGTLFENTLIWMLCKVIYRIFIIILNALFSLPSVIHTAVILAAILIVEIFLGIFLRIFEAEVVFIFVLDKIITYPAILYTAYCMKKLHDGGRALAEGNLSSKTDTTGMFGELLRHGNDLNSISNGMAAAVSEKMKSERMKTELITNVSHDIKTPLTSVINYSDLICREETDNPKIKEYSEVLLRQSVRLKKLLTDLIEASKAASGAIDVNLTPCDAAVFIEQISGEYEDKFNLSGLTSIISVPDEPITVNADGRHMQRIFDNLMENILKYSLSGTRVYINVEKKEESAVFTFRNTSRDPLGTDDDELTARFVRGDSSRSSEGSGLGLSIAKSLAEIQGGSLTVKTDGDLFKVLVSIPLA